MHVRGRKRSGRQRMLRSFNVPVAKSVNWCFNEISFWCAVVIWRFWHLYFLGLVKKWDFLWLTFLQHGSWSYKADFSLRLLHVRLVYRVTVVSQISFCQTKLSGTLLAVFLRIFSIVFLETIAFTEKLLNRAVASLFKSLLLRSRKWDVEFLRFTLSEAANLVDKRRFNKQIILYLNSSTIH